MTARSFSAFAKDAGVNAVHVTTAIGNGKKKPKDNDAAKSFATYAKASGVDEEHGLVFGWAIVSKKDGQDYFDLQGDHIPEGAMLEASADFMQHSRMAKEMHDGDQKGSVVFAFPMTSDIAKAMGVDTKTTGLMIAMKPSDPAMLAKFKSGEYTGFSIGGSRIRDKEFSE